MTQAQARVQKCLVVFARSVQVLHQTLEACAIEGPDRCLNIAPSGWSFLSASHNQNPLHVPCEAFFLSLPEVLQPTLARSLCDAADTQ